MKCNHEINSEPKVIEIYEDVVLPRKEKYDFKWAGSITNFKSKPISFVEEDPSAPAKQDEKKTQNNQFDFDFESVKTKHPGGDFNPFTTFPGKEG